VARIGTEVAIFLPAAGRPALTTDHGGKAETLKGEMGKWPALTLTLSPKERERPLEILVFLGVDGAFVRFYSIDVTC
jgi:hypothetical protein